MTGSHGGAIAVDPERLRALAADADAAASAMAAAERAAASIVELAWREGIAATEASAVHAAIVTAHAGIADLAPRLRYCADVYELAELNARLAVHAVEHPDDEIALRGRRNELARRHPEADREAQRLVEGWVNDDHTALAENQYLGLPLTVLPGMSVMVRLLAVQAIRLVLARLHAEQAGGAGRVGLGDTLRGYAPTPPLHPRDPVSVTPPTNLADLVERIPQGEDSIRVERYARADGTQSFIIYIAGTRSDEGTVLDMESNMLLWHGRRSQASQAVEEALREAGAKPGDFVTPVGHSQGAMIAAWIAAQGVYRVPTVVTVGSPVTLDVPEDTLSIDLRHDDDIVSALAGEPPAYATGSPDSVVIRRTIDPVPRWDDLRVAAHHLPEYVETATEFDTSGDPSAAVLAAQLTSLPAAGATVSSFAPTKVDPGGRRPSGIRKPAESPTVRDRTPER